MFTLPLIKGLELTAGAAPGSAESEAIKGKIFHSNLGGEVISAGIWYARAGILKSSEVKNKDFSKTY